jgi:hypothetical protein
MNVCLRDRTLLLLIAGESTNQQQAHLRSCLACKQRYQRLVQRFEVIEQTLWKTEPPILNRHLAPLRTLWIPQVAALAAVLLVIWGGLQLWQFEPHSQQSSLHSVANQWATAEPFSLFEVDSTPWITIPAPVSNEVYFQAALSEGGWPCEWQDPFLTPICEIHPFPLILAGQHLEEVLYE